MASPSNKCCPACGKALHPGNKTGYCRRHFQQFALSPDHGERVSRGLKLRYQADPELKERAREIARSNLRLPHAVEARKRTAREIRLWELGAAGARSPEARRKAARTRRENALSWCPPELRDEYSRLNRHCHVPKDEAKRIILAQHEAEMARFRRSITK